MLHHLRKQERVKYFDLLKWLLSFVTPFYMGVSLVMFFLRTVINLIVVVQLGRIIEFVVQNRPLKDYKECSYLAIALTLASIFIDMIINWLKTGTQQSPPIRIQTTMMHRLLDLGVAYKEKKDNGHLFSLFSTSVERVRRIYEVILPEIVSTSMQVLCSAFLLIHYMGFVGCFFLLCIGPSLFIQLRFNNIISRLMKVQIEKKQEFDKNIYHSIAAVKEIRANQCEVWQEKIVDNSYSNYKGARLNTIDKRYRRGGFFRINIGISLTLYYGIALGAVSRDFIGIGDLVTCSIYCSSMIFVFNGLIFNITELIPNFQSVILLKNFCDLKITNSYGKEKVDELQCGISLSNISFSYDGSKQVIKNYSVFIRKGEKVLITGASGTGKTTLLKIIAGFYTPTAGNIQWDEKKYDCFNTIELNKRIGYLFQETYLFGTTILENIKIGKSDATESQIIRAAQLAEADEFISQLPDGYNTEVGERGVLLSGGQRQRIALARLFLKEPDIVLVDEMTANLDVKNAEKIMDTLLEVYKDKTIVAITHRENENRYFDRVINLIRE